VIKVFRALALLAPVALASLAGCSPHTHTPPAESPEAEETADVVVAEAPKVPEDVVAQAARPFSGYRVFDQKALSAETFLTLLASADAVCFGELHGTALHQYAELALLRGLAERRRVRGFELLVGLEMIRTEFQPNLDYYSQNPTVFDELAPKVRWEEEWGYPRPYYAPVFEEIGLERAKMIALGLARPIARAVARGGVESLPPTQKAALPELDLGVKIHRELFDASMDSHPEIGNPDYYYQVMVIWDELMAERSVSYLADKTPARKLLLLAGQNHCHQSGIPSRMLRRAPQLSVVSVRVRDTSQSGASERDERLASGYDFELVF
jgi:uncharacterized iron-regulated protein